MSLKSVGEISCGGVVCELRFALWVIVLDTFESLSPLEATFHLKLESSHANEQRRWRRLCDPLNH